MKWDLTDTGDILKMYQSIGIGGQLQTLDNLLVLHGIDIKKIKGYEQLSEKEQEMFGFFILRYFNGWGLAARMTIRPLWVGWVEENKYSHGWELYRFKDYHVDERKKLHAREGTCRKGTEKLKEHYLRFEYGHHDYETGKTTDSQWQHLTADGEWY